MMKTFLTTSFLTPFDFCIALTFSFFFSPTLINISSAFIGCVGNIVTWWRNSSNHQIGTVMVHGCYLEKRGTDLSQHFRCTGVVSSSCSHFSLIPFIPLYTYLIPNPELSLTACVSLPINFSLLEYLYISNSLKHVWATGSLLVS